MKQLILALCMATAFAACSKRQNVVTTTNASDDAPLSLTASWVKTKGDMVDTRITLTNHTGQYVEVEPQNIQCIRNQEMGTVRHKFDPGGLIRLYPSQTRTELFFCTFATKIEAPITIKFAKIFGTGTDEEAKRKTIATNLSWSLNPTK
jgi:hypothetical protein